MSGPLDDHDGVEMVHGVLVELESEYGSNTRLDVEGGVYQCDGCSMEHMFLGEP